ncbi:MAG: glycosyltransferase, partial [Bacteroidetes bacterium]|nr:glycosyltransferase [Bacteroidota bacterium]
MLIFIAIAVFLFAAYAILMEYYRKGWDAIPVFKMNSPSAEKAIIKISVIVAVRNEEGNILHLLESLARQSYPKELYQVIVLDDCSNDRTWELMHLFSYENFNAKFIQLSDYAEKLKSASFKKFAIETGISQSTGDLIITTDADCSHHKDWLMAIAAFYQQTNAKFIAAPVKMDTDGSLLSAFQTLDFIALQGITGGSVFKKLHSMCNGANLAYEKKAYYAVNGFKGIDNI